MAGRARAVLQGSIGDSLSEGAAGGRYSYLPWVDLICAGVPCQDWSVAGKRAGLSGTRSSLVYHFARILCELRPTWFLFENVPGLLSSNDGRDFAEVLRLFMVKCGYGVQWRVLDSQFFGVAQRRRRLFIVGRFGEPCPASILFDAPGVSGSDSESRETQAHIAAPLTSGTGLCGKPAGRRMEDDYNLAVLTASAGHHGHSSDRGDGYSIVATSSGERESALTSTAYKRHDEDTDTLIATLQGGGHSGQPEPGNGIVLAKALDAEGSRWRGEDHDTCIAHSLTENMRNRSQGPANYVVGSLDASDGGYNASRAAAGHYLPSSPTDSHGVREFTGLPKGMDSPRYRALGNAVTVNVIEWIAKRIGESVNS